MDQLPRMAVARESGLAFEEHSIEGYMVLAAGHPSVVRELLECIKR